MIEKWSDFSVHKTTLEDKNYPKLLNDLKRPPKEIYYRGTLKSLSKKTLAVVGSRRMTRYGEAVLETIIPSLVANDVTIVSGFMYGVDTMAHEITTACGGRGVAVLAYGINTCYPPENDVLYKDIIQKGGAIISEYSPEAKPNLWRFPQRNRIIAVLSTLGVLVIEASEKSGSLITVKYALKLKRKLFAVPGPINSNLSTGTNYLIKNGNAKMVTTAADILKIAKKTDKEEDESLGGLEKKIYELLSNESKSIDELSMSLEINIGEISETISLMCIKGILVEELGRYRISGGR